MGVREMERFLEQWQMDARDLRRPMLLSPTPLEWERWYAMLLLAQGGPPRPRRRHWNGIPTPLDGGWPPSAREGLQP